MIDVVIYTRVSTEDQKENGFSLQDQEARLRKECLRRGYNIIRHYQDDHSAKDFNRPQFQHFLEEARSKVIKPELFFCIRMDRFTRHMQLGFDMLARLKKLNIRFETLENNVSLDSPESLVPFMMNMLIPQIDNERRGINTIRGMRQAVREGRFPWKAPKGYINNPLTKTIEIDGKYSEIIRYAFEKYATGAFSVDMLVTMVGDKGLKLVKQTLINIFKSPLYVGKIPLKAYKGEPYEVFQGQHEPLVSEEIFNAVQNLLRGKSKPFGKLNKRQEHLPLRRFLVCKLCGKKLTGSNSKSRNGSMHAYYHCQNNCKERIRAGVANDAFVNLLRGFEISTGAQVLYEAILADVFQTDNVVRIAEISELEKQSRAISLRINTLNDKYLDGLIDNTTYQDTKGRYQSLASDVNQKMINLKPVDSELKDYIKFSLGFNKDMSRFYERADFLGKQQIVGSIFPENLIFETNGYRTTRLNEAVQLMINTDKAFRQNGKKKATKNRGLSSVAPPSGLEPETL